MTALELHNHFKLLANSVGSLNFANFEPEEIDELLNKAQIQLIKNLVGPFNPYQIGLEGNKKITDDLQGLIRSQMLPPSSPGALAPPNCIWFVLPDDWWHSLEEQGVHYVECGDEPPVRTFREVIPIRHNETKSLSNVFLRPNERKHLRKIHYGKIELYYQKDTTPPIQLFLRYLHIPAKISIDLGVTSELHEPLHEELVNLAVELAQKAILNPNANISTKL